MATSAARKPAAPARKAPAPKSTARAAAKQPAAATRPDAPKAPAKAAARVPPEAKKLKLVRDSFTIPKLEYRMLDILKTRASRLGRPAKKSELVRAGLKALEAMSDPEFLACIASLPAAKPAKAKAKPQA